jgi:hypothetical protein
MYFLRCQCTARGAASKFTVIKHVTSLVAVCTAQGLEWAVGNQERCGMCRYDPTEKTGALVADLDQMLAMTAHRHLVDESRGGDEPV